MPTYSEIQLAIETRFDAQWVDDTVELRYENEKRKRPTGPHIILNIRTGRAREVGISGGSVLYRRPGWIVAQCFIQVREGTQRLRVIANDIINIFEGQTFSNITFDVSEVIEVGDDKKGFYQVNAKIFFEHDFERTIT